MVTCSEIVLNDSINQSASYYNFIRFTCIRFALPEEKRFENRSITHHLEEQESFYGCFSWVFIESYWENVYKNIVVS